MAPSPPLHKAQSSASTLALHSYIYIKKTFMGIIWGNCITGWTVVILFHILSYFPVPFDAAAAITAASQCEGLWTASDGELPGLGSGEPPAASALKTTHRRILILLLLLPSGPSQVLLPCLLSRSHYLAPDPDIILFFYPLESI